MKTTIKLVALVIAFFLIGTGSGYLFYPYFNPPTVEKEPIKIGVVVGLTGYYALEGAQGLMGFRMAVDEINDAGGVLGRPLELVVEDDRRVVAESIAATKKLIDIDGVHYILSGFYSGGTLAIMPVVKEKEVVLFNVASTSPHITEESGVGGNPWVFTTCPDEAKYAEAFAKVIGTEEVPIKSFAFLGPEGTYGRDSCEAFKKCLPEHGGTLTSDNFYSWTTPDFITILTKIKAEDPEGIIAIASASHLLGILKQAHELGMNQPIISRPAGLGPEFIEEAGGLAEGVLGLDPWYDIIDTAENREFLEKFKRYAGAVPINYGPWSAYEAVHVLALAIEEAGVDDADAVRIELGTIDYPSATGGSIKFDEYNSAHNYVFVGKVENGKVVILTKAPG